MKENKPTNKSCSKCGAEFTCKSLSGGCWCNNYQLTVEQLDVIKKSYDNCLCEKCIASITVIR